MFPAHFPDAPGGRVLRAGRGFAYDFLQPGRGRSTT
jgi:hypothetical protein